MGTCFCASPRTRSASDHSDKNKSSPKFTAVNKADEDLDEIANDGQTTTHIPDLKHVASETDPEQQPIAIAQLDFDPKLMTLNIHRVGLAESQPLPVMNTLTVSQTKSLIAKHIGIHEARQQLKFKHILLENNKTIGSYDINDGDTIDVHVLEDSNVLEVLVDYKSGTIKKSVFCTSSTKLIDFRKEVQGKIPNVALNEQQFFYNDVELTEDDKQMKDYGIVNGCTLKFEWKNLF